jgi:transposase
VRRVELGITDREVFISQVHPPGAEAAVDFGEFEILLAGAVVKVWMFVMRLSCSGKAFHVAYPTQAQEAFLAGHVAAFEYFGGVPGRIRYDNLKPAVTRVLMGRDRTESDRFIALRSHYGSTRSSATPASRERARRAAWKVRSTGSAAGTWCRCRISPRWPSSPSWSRPATPRMTTG